MSFINESFDFITTIEYNGKLFASSKSRSFFVIFVMIIKIFELWLLSSFYDYKYTLKYFTVLRLIWSEISAFHDMTTKY